MLENKLSPKDNKRIASLVHIIEEALAEVKYILMKQKEKKKVETIKQIASEKIIENK